MALIRIRMDPELGKFKAGSGSGINQSGSYTGVNFLLQKFCSSDKKCKIMPSGVGAAQKVDGSETLLTNFLKISFRYLSFFYVSPETGNY